MTLKFDAQQFDALERVAEKIFRSGVCPPDVKNADAAFAIMLAGAEMGFEPMQSIRLISLVKGKVSLNADAQIAMCTRVRDVCEYFRLAESTAERATFVTHRKGHPAPVELTWTFEQAKAAGLTGSSTWKAHPGAMLRARCGAALARAVYPDLVAGVYDPDEAEEIRRDEPSDHSRPQLAAPDPLARFRERAAVAASSTELVALVLSLPVAQRETARPVAETRAQELGESDFAARVAKAEGLSREPSAWSLASDVLAEIAAAKSDEDLTAVLRARGAAVAKLPAAVGGVLSACYNQRRKALSPPSIAAGFERELRAATDIPTLDAIGERLQTAAAAQQLTAAETTHLSALYNGCVDALERPASEAA